MNKSFITVFTSLVFISTILQSSVVDKVIVKVNNENILKSEYDKLVEATLTQFRQITPKEEQTPQKEKELKEKILDQLIIDKLLLQEAKRLNIKVAKREVEEGIKMVKSRFPNDEAFKLELKKENLTEKQFEERITNQLMQLKLIEEQVKKKVPQPTEEEAKKVYDQIISLINSGNLKTSSNDRDEIKLLAQLVSRYFDEQVRVRHILIRVDKDASKEEKAKAKKTIEDIRKKIVAGEDFADLAKKYSEDPGSKDRGGDLGFIAKGDTVPEFEKVAFALKEGETSSVVETPYGYHIIRLIERKKKRNPDFEEIKQDLLQYVYTKNSEKYYEQYIEDLKKRATIKYVSSIE